MSAGSQSKSYASKVDSQLASAVSHIRREAADAGVASDVGSGMSGSALSATNLMSHVSGAASASQGAKDRRRKSKENAEEKLAREARRKEREEKRQRKKDGFIDECASDSSYVSQPPDDAPPLFDK